MAAAEWEIHILGGEDFQYPQQEAELSRDPVKAEYTETDADIRIQKTVPSRKQITHSEKTVLCQLFCSLKFCKPDRGTSVFLMQACGEQYHPFNTAAVQKDSAGFQQGPHFGGAVRLRKRLKLMIFFFTLTMLMLKNMGISNLTLPVHHIKKNLP